ncbi:hypothetical protein AB0F17_35340 [Nonomuraea sp. NPDC026600]|uniref:hypothetical protein n=1 Tax=Nonomuraea sp. NPDC026600 TaxID=3155363 RepID=UPI0033F28D85
MLAEKPLPEGLQALAYATARDGNACRRALAEAEQAVAASERAASPPRPWVFPFTAAKLAGYRALCAVRLAQPGEALTAFSESLTATQPAEKQRAILILEIAAVKRMKGQFDEAFTLAATALSTGVLYGAEGSSRPLGSSAPPTPARSSRPSARSISGCWPPWSADTIRA